MEKHGLISKILASTKYVSKISIKINKFLIVPNFCLVATLIGTEGFINSSICLFDECEVQRGTHEYKFCFPLPQNLPYSLKILFDARISYYVKAELVIPMWLNETSQVDFEIVRFDDLNLYPELKEPMMFSRTKIFSSLFTDHKPLFMIVTIPCRGFAINQFAHIVINYINDSHIDIVGTLIRLIKLTIYTFPRAGNPKTNTYEEVILETEAEGVAAKSSKNIKSGITIPKVMTSNDKFCDVITIRYVIEVIARTNWMHTNEKIRLPITIGDAPLRV